MPERRTAPIHPSNLSFSSNKAGKLQKYVRTLVLGACVVGAGLAYIIDYRLTREELRNSEENREKMQKDMSERGLTAEEYRHIKGKITAEVPRRMSALTPKSSPSKAELDLQMETVRGKLQRSEEAPQKGLEQNAELEKRQKAERAESEYMASPEYKRKVVRARELEEARLALQHSEKQSLEKKEELMAEVERTARQKAIDTGAKDLSGRYYPSIPSGEFQMGSSKEPDSSVRMVLLETFVIGQSEITYGEWTSTLKWANAHEYDIRAGGEGKDPSHPVTNVSWFEAVAWSNAKSEREGLTPCYYLTEKAEKHSVYRVPTTSGEPPKVHWHADGYRLPTEAEWEKAARGGHVDWLYPNGNTLTKADANFSNEGGGTAPVMSYKPNSYALFDMAGNVWEWCWNTHGIEGGFSEQTARGIRGGGWELNAEGCRVSFTAAAFAETKSNDRGFRLVRRPRETAVRGGEAAAMPF